MMMVRMPCLFSSLSSSLFPTIAILDCIFFLLNSFFLLLLVLKKGHVCLTDFGLSKQFAQGDKAQTFCGTPEYLGNTTVIRDHTFKKKKEKILMSLLS